MKLTTGDEIWLSFLAFPQDMAYFKLDVNNSDGLKTTDINVSENEIISMDKKMYRANLIMTK